MAQTPPANEITKALSGADFPASKDQLVSEARDNNAGQDVVDAISNLPQQNYETMADVQKAFGQST